MHKKLIRSSIIVLIQAILPIIALLLITPWLIQSQSLNQLHHYLNDHQLWFIVWHGILYLILIVSWPTLVNKLSRQTQFSNKQIKRIIRCRWYLIITFISIDSLMLWG